eukprot:2052642-Lingulodinium_polyedra.AAC.1
MDWSGVRRCQTGTTDAAPVHENRARASMTARTSLYSSSGAPSRGVVAATLSPTHGDDNWRPMQ